MTEPSVDFRVPARAVAIVLGLLAVSPAAEAQRGTGELRVRVTDSTGLALEAAGRLESAATGVRRSFTADAGGSFIAQDLPFGIYRLQIASPGFSPFTATVDVRSEVPQAYPVVLRVAPVTADIVVTPDVTILDPFRPGSASFIGADLFRDRPSASPGRSLIDLVNTQAGWLLEANGILHPRGSEYQVQYVIDGIPFRDNRSPAFAQSLGSDEFESMTVRTAGYPAEFGGKLGGVIEVNTVRDARQGLHGTGTAQGGSFAALSGFFFGQYARGGTTTGVSLEGMRTDRYLDPPVEANYTNDGAARGFAAHLEREWSGSDRTRAYVARRTAGFSVPNEAIQEEAGQRQTRTSGETLAQATHQRVVSDRTLATVRVMARETTATLAANALSTPIQPSQDRGFRELYVNGAMSTRRGRHELKFGGEAIFGTVRESFASTITAYRLNGVRVFDRDLPATFSFAESRPDREQSAYAQDLMRLGAVTVSAGLRYDHYALMVDEHAVSPRLAVSWHVPAAGLVAQASYDRAFQTPSIENVILSSSDLVTRLGGEGRSLSLRSSRGHFSEIGLSKVLWSRARLDASYFYRTASHFADDDVLLNTAVSFPIAFSRGTVRGFEAKFDVARWGRLAGSLAYSHLEGIGQLPISGGLFLGDEVAALLNAGGTFPITQDQRHTARGRLRYQIGPRGWLASAFHYNSGLPLEIEGPLDLPSLAEQYGRAVVDRVDFEDGRIRPSASIDASFGWNVLESGQRAVRLQLDGFNLTDRLDVINFSGLLSGTAVAPRRAWAVRLTTAF